MFQADEINLETDLSHHCSRFLPSSGKAAAAGQFPRRRKTGRQEAYRVVLAGSLGVGVWKTGPGRGRGGLQLGLKKVLSWFPQGAQRLEGPTESSWAKGI